jgi:hypothetical protein
MIDAKSEKVNCTLGRLNTVHEAAHVAYTC